MAGRGQILDGNAQGFEKRDVMGCLPFGDLSRKQRTDLADDVARQCSLPFSSV
jgi:hypothetical protein